MDITSSQVESIVRKVLSEMGTSSKPACSAKIPKTAKVAMLTAQKKMHGAMKLTNVSELVMEVFEMTGFVDILVIE